MGFELGFPGRVVEPYNEDPMHSDTNLCYVQASAANMNLSVMHNPLPLILPPPTPLI